MINFPQIVLMIISAANIFFAQINLDQAAKITGLLMFFFMALGVIITAIWYLASGRSRVQLEKNNEELTATNKTLTESLTRCRAANAQKDAKLEIKKRTGKKKQKVILKLAAKLTGENISQEEIDAIVDEGTEEEWEQI